MPIWIALYQVLRRTLGDTPEQLLRLSSDLYDWAYITSAIPINRDFLFFDLGSSSLEQSLPLAILVGVTAYIQQKVSTARMGPRDERSESMNRTMLWMMPFMFGFFTLQVPAGLGLYWLVTSILHDFDVVLLLLLPPGPEVVMEMATVVRAAASSCCRRCRDCQWRDSSGGRDG